jgi:hypothetical protein
MGYTLENCTRYVEAHLVEKRTFLHLEPQRCAADDDIGPPQYALRRLKTDTLVDYGCNESLSRSESPDQLSEDEDSCEEEKPFLASGDTSAEEDEGDWRYTKKGDQKVEAAFDGQQQQHLPINQGLSVQQLYLYVPLPGSPLWSLGTGMGLKNVSAAPATALENSASTALARAQAARLQNTASILEARAEKCEVFANCSATSGLCEQARGNKDALTTLMLRNLPNDYTRSMTLELLDSKGLAGKYDFVYVPIDFNRRAGLGYAFVNLISRKDAENARSLLQGFKQWSVQSPKVCEVCWGEPLQGFEAHVERYRSSPVMHKDVPDEFKPAIFQGGVRLSFPPPTKRVRPPRSK